MKIAIIGATGYVGSKILHEALERGHDVTGIVRNPEKLPVHKKLKPMKGDIKESMDLAKKLAGHDVIISSVVYNDPELLLEAIKQSGVRRFIAMGGAGSLEIKPGLLVIDTPEFPKEYLFSARPALNFFNILKKETDLDWTVVSPSMLLLPGERTTKYRMGSDNPLFNEKGQSSISLEDLAHALLNEAEHPKHIRKRFTVGY